MFWTFRFIRLQEWEAVLLFLQLLLELVKLQTLYDKSFAVKGPQLWNIVDKNIKSIVTLEQFKVKLGKFLAEFPDKPPVAGYVVQNNNSLLEWRSSVYL